MSSAEKPAHRIDTYLWEGEGYRSFVSYSDWLVALMNWEARFDRANVGSVERHNATDEVFVLTRGRGFLFVETGEGIQGVDMLPGVLYNVTKGTWHSVLGTRDAGWLIVESNDTSEANSEYRNLTDPELEVLKGQYPDWLRGDR